MESMKIVTIHMNIDTIQTISRWTANRFKLPKVDMFESYHKFPYEDWYESKNTDPYQSGQKHGQRGQMNRLRPSMGEFLSWNKHQKNIWTWIT